MFVYTVAFSLFINSYLLIGAKGDTAQYNSMHAFEVLAQNSKIIESEWVLRDFKEGQTTTRVIVSLSKPARFEQEKDFKDPAYRSELREAVQTAQEQVISRLDPGEVQITNRFVYVFGFSAVVTLDGLKELTEINEVLTISKDRVLEMHN
jgi:hypothetical protein